MKYNAYKCKCNICDREFTSSKYNAVCKCGSKNVDVEDND